ncbi:MAG: hypothetical protein JO316_14905 [Abitibacteriaceae bacterium]|nr:hypothetical protein [Abditibacteriaceae bacterium]
MKLFRLLLALAWCFNGTLKPSLAQQSATHSPTVRHNSKFIVTTRSGKKMVSLDGQAMPLFWAQGITQVADLDSYAHTGFNTVVVRLSWRPTPDGSLVPTDLDGPRAFANAAAQQGLHVIYSLPPAPFGMERNFRVSADSEPYLMVWSAWVMGAMTSLKDTPNLIGWMLPDDPRALPYFDDKGFAKWLADNYADVGVINRQWAANFPTMDDVTIDAVEKLIEQWRHAADPDNNEAQPPKNLKERLKEKNQRPEQENFAFHPAALALAHYKWEAYKALLSQWTAIMRKVDAGRLIFSGRLPDYAQLLSLPPDIDVSIPDIPPGVGEADTVTHNPQTIDIARRGGRFAALPVLSTAGSIALPEEDLPRLIPTWADAALAHGASGLIFDSWQDLQDNAALHRAVTSTLERLQRSPFVELWTQPVTATAAVVLTPLADGYTRQGGSEALPDVRGLYGFADDLVSGEPSDLVYALRWGTAFGSIDYLSPDELDGATGSPLNHYSILLLPQALSVSGAMVQQLGQYADAGGVVLADLGAGAAQAEGKAITVPPDLANLFGLAPPGAAPIANIKYLSFNLQSMLPHPLLPTWSRLAGGRPGTILTGGDGPNGAAFAGPVAFPNPMPGTLPLALAEQTALPVGKKIRPNGPALLQRSMLTLKEIGHGYALFAPFQMWTFWRPGQFGFDSFHGDLFQRGAAVVQLGASSLVPSPAPDAPELYPEITNYPDAIALLNHNPAQRVMTPDSSPSANLPQVRANAQAKGMTPPPPQIASPVTGGQQTVLQTTGVGNFLWGNAVCFFPTGDAAQLSGGRPAPIGDPTEFETQPHLVTLYVNTRAQEMSVLRLLPIRAQNTEGGSLITNVADYGPQGVRLLVWPNATKVIPQPQAQDFQISVADAGKVHVTFYDVSDKRNYRVLPNSRHHVVITNLLTPPDKQGRRPSTNQTLIADEQGHLNLDLTGATLAVEIHPLP